jgi:hypothetical protein
MRSKHVELALRQQLLLLRSAELRASAADDLLALQPPLRWADRARDGWQWVKGHPAVPLTAVAVIALLRPRRALRWSLKAWGAWRMWRRLRRTLVAAGVLPQAASPASAGSPGGGGVPRR